MMVGRVLERGTSVPGRMRAYIGRRRGRVYRGSADLRPVFPAPRIHLKAMGGSRDIAAFHRIVLQFCKSTQ
jgi:hypothetical protein